VLPGPRADRDQPLLTHGIGLIGKGVDGESLEQVGYERLWSQQPAEPGAQLAREARQLAAARLQLLARAETIMDRALEAVAGPVGVDRRLDHESASGRPADPQ